MEDQSSNNKRIKEVPAKDTAEEKYTPEERRKAFAQRTDAILNFASLKFANVVWICCFVIIILIISISYKEDNPSELLEQILEYALTATFTVIASITGYVFGSRRNN